MRPIFFRSFALLRLKYIVILGAIWASFVTVGWSQSEPGWDVASLFQESSDPVLFQATNESRLWIEGSTNVSHFQCKAKELKGFGSVAKDRILWKPTDPKDPEVGERATATISVEVASLDCGKERMNEDMYKALKADQFDFIQFELVEAGSPYPYQADTLTPSDKWYRLRVQGTLRIAGVEHKVNIPLHTELVSMEKMKFRLKGVHPLKMTAYDITPPSALYGLIQVHNQLTVHFDLIVEPSHFKARQQYEADGSPPN